jgi:hypothetical protein
MTVCSQIQLRGFVRGAVILHNCRPERIFRCNPLATLLNYLDTA